MNGAHALLHTLVDSGVDVCFTNPGTSEMHFVAAVDDVPAMRTVLGLFEGVVTGAADGYARILDRPAATLLHLGPGMANGMANLHNARRAIVPMVNIVGDHATYHKKFDAPLESDIESAARVFSDWVRRPIHVQDLAHDAAEAVQASLGPPATIATLILPADVSWNDGAAPAPQLPRRLPRPPDGGAIAEAAAALRSGEPCLLLLGGQALRAGALRDASRIVSATGAHMLSETFPTRVERGAGRPSIDRLQYRIEAAVAQLAGVRHLILVGARSPVSFFAYPDAPSELVPEGCAVHSLVGPDEDTAAALSELADRVASDASPILQMLARPALPGGPLTSSAAASIVGALLPEDVIVVDEGGTAGAHCSAATMGSPAHDWLKITGGAIGIGLPLAVGASIAAPSRKVLVLQADGSAMYTIQALWTMARECLNITIVVFNNRSYGILESELRRVGATPGPKALDMLDLSRPDIDFVGIAQGMGVEGEFVRTAEEFASALRRALADDRPRLVDAVLQ